MFELLYLQCNYGKMSKEGFQSYLSKEKQQANAMKSNPRMAFMMESQKYLYKDNPYANDFPSPEEFDEINPKNALAFYNERFKSAYGMHYVFVGSFDEKEIKPLVTRYIGGMSGKKVATNFRDVGKERRKGNNKFEYKKGSEQQAMIMDMMYGDAKYDPLEATKLYILSQVVNRKITKKLREEIGGMYSGGMGIRLTQYPKPSYTVSSFIPCGPEKLAELRTAYEAILKEVQKTGGITKADVNEATQPALQKYSENLKENNYWLGTLSSSFYNNTDPKRIFTYPERIKSITPAELNRLAKKYLNAPNKFQNQWVPAEVKP
jgi:zinc protease